MKAETFPRLCEHSTLKSVPKLMKRGESNLLSSPNLKWRIKTEHKPGENASDISVDLNKVYDPQNILLVALHHVMCGIYFIKLVLTLLGKSLTGPRPTTH